MGDICTNVGWNVYALRMNKGWTQYDLAEEAHVGQNTVWAIETGRMPTRRTVKKLADALGTDAHVILGEKVELTAEPRFKLGKPSKHWRSMC